MVLGGVEVAGDHGGARGGGREVRDPAEFPLPQVDLARQGRERVRQLEPYGHARDVRRGARHAHGRRDHPPAAQRVRAEQDRADRALAVDGGVMGEVRGEGLREGVPAGAVALRDEDELGVLPPDHLGQRPCSLAEFDVRGDDSHLRQRQPVRDDGLRHVRHGAPGGGAEDEDRHEGQHPSPGGGGEEQGETRGDRQPGEEGEELGNRGDRVRVQDTAGRDQGGDDQEQSGGPGRDAVPGPEGRLGGRWGGAAAHGLCGQDSVHSVSVAGPARSLPSYRPRASDCCVPYRSWSRRVGHRRC